MSTTFFATWLRLVKQNPVAFNSLTGCGLCASSDAVAQYLEDRKNNNNQNSNNNDETASLSFRVRRIMSAGLIGFCFGGWVYPAAYARLDSMWKGTHFTAVLQKSVVEIATVGIFVNTVSMTCRGLLVGRDTRNVASHVVTEMPQVTLNDARVWLPYNMIAFSMIPAPIRPTTTLMMEAGWQTYISLMSNNYGHETVEQATATPMDDDNSSNNNNNNNNNSKLPLGILSTPVAGDVVMATSPKS